MATRNINLTPALDAYVAEQVASGQFQNASEVLRAGLRALKAEQAAHAAKVEALRAAIQVAEDDLAAGRFVEVDDIDTYFDEIDKEMEAEFDAEAAAARSPAE